MSFCIRVMFTKDLRLVTDGKRLVQFANPLAAHAYIINNQLINKAHPHPMLDNNDWYDYRRVPLKILQASKFKPAYSVWSKK